MGNLVSQKRGMHRQGSVQLKTWVPAALRDEFASVCARQQVTAASVLRGLLSAYVEQMRPTQKAVAQHD